MNKQRNFGIDLLRIVSMYMIIILHLLWFGGVLGKADFMSANYLAAWFLEILSYCAVNCFAIISGFVMHNSRAKASRLLELWLQTFFYSATITVLMFLVFPESRSLAAVIDAVFPVLRGKYWYISAYFGMYLFVPFLNKAVNSFDRKTLEKFLLAVFLLVSVFCIPFRSDPFGIKDGYSVAWLCILYILGGYMEKYNIPAKFGRKKCLVLFGASVFATFASKIFIELLTNRIFGEPKWGRVLISYVSPTIVLAAVFLFIFFANFKLSRSAERIVKFFSPAALSVYIIHLHPLILQTLLTGSTEKLINLNFAVMISLVILIAAVCYIACSLIDIIRIKLFVILKTEAICGKIETGIRKIFDECVK